MVHSATRGPKRLNNVPENYVLVTAYVVEKVLDNAAGALRFVSPSMLLFQKYEQEQVLTELCPSNLK